MQSSALRHDAVSNHSPQQASILLVEDELMVRMFVADSLRDAGYQVVEATSGDEAVDILVAGTAIDLVFSDVRLPGALDGLGLLAFVNGAFPTLPVVITSGHLPPDLAVIGGASKFLPKPYRVDQILGLIGRELGEGR